MRLLFVVNWTDTPQQFNLGSSWEDVFAKRQMEEVLIPANDLRILEEA